MKKTKNTKTNEQKRVALPFYICTLCVPILAIFLTFLNFEFGVTCGDGCSVHSYTTHYIIQFLFGYLALLNVFLFVLSKKAHKNKALCLWTVVINCTSCLGLYFLSENIWALLLIAIPFQFIVPVQIALWACFLFDEVLEKK